MNRVKFLLVVMIALLLILPSALPTNGQTNLFNMSYIFMGGPDSHLVQVNRTKGSLDVVSPNYFDIDENGKLIKTWTLDSDFINEMHNRGMRVVPFLSNHWNITAGKKGLDRREQLAKEVAFAIDQYNLDGVNVDIEGVNHTYRDAHTDFVRLLRKYIPNHKEVSVAVAANPNGWNTGWHGFYDYKGLSNHADYLMIMAYDESWESPQSPVGPVSSISFFTRSVEYAINQGVPKERIVVGLPFYGRLWKTDGPTSEGITLAGRGISGPSVETLVSKYKGRIDFDEKTQTPKATFTIPNGQQSFLGKTILSAGEYVIWYENESSIRAKLRVPSQYGIKGTGSWALGHDTPHTWNYYTEALNWKAIKHVVTRFGSGPMGVTTSKVNFRESPSKAGTILGEFFTDTPLKITGDPVTADALQWYPIQLADETEGFVAGDFLKTFLLKELYGKSRYDTSILVSNEGWKEKSNAVILGRGDLPIDALTGSVLATKNESPLLLTGSSSLPDSVLEEINRLSPTTVFLLGGKAAISESIESTLKELGYTVRRIAGKSRYDTSIQVAAEVGIQNEIILTTGKDSPDALSVAPYAGIKQIPILLTKQNSLPDEVRNFVLEHSISKITIIGGEGAVSGNIIKELQELGITNIDRVSGKSRYDTSVAIATRFKDDLDISSLYFASGVSYIDALPGSPLAAKNGAPILLVNNGDLPASVVNFLQEELPATPNVNIIGGYGVISDATRTNVFKALK